MYNTSSSKHNRVSVPSEYHTYTKKYHSLRGLKATETFFFFHGLGEWEVQNQDASIVEFWWEPSLDFRVPDC